MNMNHVRRWTPLVLAFPRRYIDTEYPWHQFSLSAWNYDWREDPWGGLYDTLKPPAETVQDGRGDCEDYAFVVLSSLNANENVDELYIGVAGKRWRPPSHVFAYAESKGPYESRTVYSSGEVTYGSVDNWLSKTQYDWARTRKI